ncbi:DUF4252 domain-containing protein [Polaribacter aestuariivivens]|uniref:DUF4252 domain-containing protein n=1 Tax=Polaribacter aestuariivivens TaxID=2304626 RepID=A0A5S3NDK3_9FLAO|nr:DUF4252 domain-containing protein [Polaribacter aestuariivivens]TMM31186.1 DUF4252 domain-containing protein [Polaribacter aestuariivivens]
MKKLTTICTLFVLVLFASSCKNEKSLQQYLVDVPQKEGFVNGDLPISSLLTTKTDVSDDVKETLKSIKKINVAYLLKTADNDAAYEKEKATLKNIFSSEDYKTLMSMKMKGMNMNVYYTGDTDSLDEVIVFGYGKKSGVGVARLLGDNMNPAKVIEMLNSVKFDGDEAAIKQFTNMFNQ